MAATYRILNPARRVRKRRRRNPPQLLVINSGGRMATRRRRRRTVNTRRRRTTNRRRAAVRNPRRRRRNRKVTVVNPRRRRRRANRTVNPRRRRRRTYNPRNPRRRRRNPVRHHRRRRRNPSLSGLTGLLEETITALVGAGVVSYAYGMVGPMVPIPGILGQIGVKLGLAWGLGEAAKRFGFAKHARMLSIGGAISAGQDAINYFIGGGGLLFPGPQAKPGQALIPADLTGDSTTPAMSEIVYAPAGYGGLGEIVYAPNIPALYA